MSLPPSDRPIIHVLIGQVHVARPPHVLFAVLGSCVGVSVLDRVGQVGGMAHILLPQARGAEDPQLPGKYADRAVDCLLDTLAEVGADAKRFVAFLAGGGALCHEGDAHAQIGRANAEAALAALRRRRVPIAEQHLGGHVGRKVTLRVASAEHVVEVLRATDPALEGERRRLRAPTVSLPLPQNHP